MSGLGLKDDDLFSGGSLNPVPQLSLPAAAPGTPSKGLSDKDLFQDVPQQKPIVAAAVPAPKKDISLGQRAWGAFSDAVDHSVMGTIGRYVDESNQRDQVRQLREWGQTEAADRLERSIGVPQPSQVAYENAPSALDPNASLGTKIIRSAVQVPSMFAGAVLSPEGWVTDIPGVSNVVAPFVEKGVSKIAQAVVPKVIAPVLERAAPAIGRTAAASASQGFVQGAADPLEQTVDIAAGHRDGYDPMQTLAQAAMGAGLGAVLHGAGEFKSVLGNVLQDWRIRRTMELNNQDATPVARDAILGPRPEGPLPGETPPAEGQPQTDMRGQPIEQAPAAPAEPVPPAEPAPAGPADLRNSDAPYVPPVAEPPAGAVDLRGRPMEGAPETPPAAEPVPETAGPDQGEPPPAEPAPVEPVAKTPDNSETVAPQPVQPEPKKAPEAQPEPTAPPPAQPAPAPTPTPAPPAKAAKVAKASANKAQPLGADNRYPTDDAGHVLSERGEAIRFPTQEQASKWIDSKKGGAASNQGFKIVKHPNEAKPAYSVQDRAPQPKKSADGGATADVPAGSAEPVPQSSPDAHDTAQSAIDADVKKAQDNGTIKVPDYDHAPAAEPVEGQHAQGEPAKAAGEGTAQSGGPTGASDKPDGKSGGESATGATGGETGGAKQEPSSSAGGKPDAGTGPVGADKPGNEKPAGKAADEGSKPSKGGATDKVEPDVKPEPKKAEAKKQEPFKHTKTGAKKPADVTEDYANFAKESDHPDTEVGTAHTIKDYLVSRGKASGHETLIFHDVANNTTPIAHTAGSTKEVVFPLSAMHIIIDPRSDIVGHHNHPNNSALSGADMGVLAYPGMSAVVAHGHDGSFFTARPGPEILKMREAAKFYPAQAVNAEKIRAKAKELAAKAADVARAAYKSGRLTADETNLAYGRAFNQAMEREGYIEYTTNRELPDHVEAAVEDFVQAITARDPGRPARTVGYEPGIDELYKREPKQSGPGSEGSGGAKPGVSEEVALEAALKKSDEAGGGTVQEKVHANVITREKMTSTPVGNVGMWDEIAKSLKDVFGWVGDSAKAWADEWRDNLSAFSKGNVRPQSVTLTGKVYDALAPMISWAERTLKDKDGVLRSRATARNSPVMRKIADLFFTATEGVANVGKAKEEDYFTAKYRWENKWKNQYAKATAYLSKLSREQRNAQLEQIGRLVQNPKNIVRGTPMGDAAHEITALFKEMHAYLRDAGVDVGNVREGYLPRIEDTQKILANQNEFIQRATEAYQKSGVIDLHEAAVAARDWLDRVTLGDQGVGADGMPLVQGGKSVPSNFTKARVLSKEADNIMGDFYLQNVRDIVPRYVRQAVARAEWSRRLGVRDPGTKMPEGMTVEDQQQWREDPNGKWKDMLEELRREGNGDLSGTLNSIVRSMTGQEATAPGMYGGRSTAHVWLRTINILGKLSYSVLTSLAEPFTHAVQTGNVKDALTAYKGLVQHWVPALHKLGDGQYMRDLASDLNIIGDHWDQSSALQLTGGESGSLVADKLVEKFFRLTGQAQFTEANRIAAVGIGQTFLRRLAKDVVADGHFKNISSNILKDFGVEDPEAFAKYVSSLDKPTAAQLESHGEMGRAYSRALQRYVHRTVMHPTDAMKPMYAKHPLGSLVFALQSFNYAFKKQVLDHVVKSGWAAVDPKSGLNGYERLRAGAPIANLALMVATSYAIGEIRDQLLPDPSKADQDPMSGLQKANRAASRVGLYGYADPLVNMLTQARYQTDVATALAGPVLGPIGTAFGATADLARSVVAPNEDEEDSNARSRRVAQSAWDVIVRPAMQSAVTAGVPGGAASRAAATAFSYALADRRTRAAFVDAAGGEKD